MGRRGNRSKSIYVQVKSLVNQARSYGSTKRNDPPEVRKVSIYCINSYEKTRSVGMSFARWLVDQRRTTHFQMVTVSPGEVGKYVEHRLEQYNQGKITAATLQTDISELKKIERMVNHRFGRINWEIPDERGKRREKWGLPKRERDKTTTQRGPAYTEKQADKIVTEVEKRYGRQMADALRFCRATGCRLESLVKLKEKGVRAERIDTEAGTVTLLEKGGKWRTLKYDQQYNEFMRNIKEQAENADNKGPLLADLRSREMPVDRDIGGVSNEQLITWERSAARRLEIAVKEIAEENGFRGRGIHGFRKEFSVRRHAEYMKEVRGLVRTGDWQGLSAKYEVSEQKARDMVASWLKAGKDQKERRTVARAMDYTARLKLSKDLGHNRVDVTFAYVPKKK